MNKFTDMTDGLIQAAFAELNEEVSKQCAAEEAAYLAHRQTLLDAVASDVPAPHQTRPAPWDLPDVVVTDDEIAREDMAIRKALGGTQ